MKGSLKSNELNSAVAPSQDVFKLINAEQFVIKDRKHGCST